MNSSASDKKIVSVSRRSDIPAKYHDWFAERIRLGFAEYRHPFSNKLIKVSLKPEHVAGFVFWSKDFRPFFPVLESIFQKYPCYFHYTITGYGKDFEIAVPHWKKSVETCRELSERTSPSHVILRYDPIIINKKYSVEFHIKRFQQILELLEGKVEQCIISFVHIYSKIKKNLQRLGCNLDVNFDMKLNLSERLKCICQQTGFSLTACCCPELNIFGINPAKCISSELFSQLYPDFPQNIAEGPTRKGCGCDKCQDIGFYDTCPHGCIYCYANSRHNLAAERYNNHNWRSNSLV